MQLKPTSLTFLFLVAALSGHSQSSPPSPGLIVPGRIGNAMKFDGAHYVRPPGLGTLEKGTISIWIRPEKNPEQIITLLNTEHWQGSACHFQLVDGVAQFSVADAIEIRSEARPGYKFGDWQHIVAMHDSSARTVPEIQPLLSWDELVPEPKRAALHEYLKDKKGHPPRGY